MKGGKLNFDTISHEWGLLFIAVGQFCFLSFSWCICIIWQPHQKDTLDGQLSLIYIVTTRRGQTSSCWSEKFGLAVTPACLLLLPFQCGGRGNGSLLCKILWTFSFGIKRVHNLAARSWNVSTRWCPRYVKLSKAAPCRKTGTRHSL